MAYSFYGENYSFTAGLQAEKVPFVLALPPSYSWWHKLGTLGSVQEVALASAWQEDEPGAWVEVVRSFRDGHQETWWVLEGVAGPFGPEKSQRLVITTTDPASLPEQSTWYLLINLPAPGSKRVKASEFTPAELAEVVRLYG